MDLLRSLHACWLNGLAISAAIGVVGHRTVAAALEFEIDLLRSRHARRRPQDDGLAIIALTGMVGIIWYSNRAFATSLAIMDLLRSLHACWLNGLAISAAIGVVGHRTVAAALEFKIDLIRSRHARRRPQDDGLAIRPTIGMVGHRTLAA